MFSIKHVWVLVAGPLVMFSSSSFAMVETGLARAKNARETSAMNFMIYPLAASRSTCTASRLVGALVTAHLDSSWYSPTGRARRPEFELDGLTAEHSRHQRLRLERQDDVSEWRVILLMVFMDTTATIPPARVRARSWKRFVCTDSGVALPYCIYASLGRAAAVGSIG